MERENSMEHAKHRLLDAALPHVPFDGWSDATLKAAMRDSDVAEGLAMALFPRGGVDLAAAYHQRGDAAMAEALASSDLTALRLREKIAHAVMQRLEVADRELVRRGSALFALPMHAVEGAGLIWGTADRIWGALGDSSRDLNWYTKRATLSGVYGATVLFWLGDTAEGAAAGSRIGAATAEFLDRRIENVMQFEKAKAGFRQNPVGKALSGGLSRIFDAIQAPQRPDDLPGRSGR